MHPRFASLCGVLLLMVGACAPTGPAGSTGGAPSEPSSSPSGQRKIITLAVLQPVTTLGPWETAARGGTGPIQELHSNGLITSDPNGGYEPRLLSKLPSLQDGTIVMLPDGRMQTTWSLRPNAKWQDGTPLTTDDLTFTFQVYRDPDVPFAATSTGSTTQKNIESIEALDATTAVATWKSAYYRPFDLGVRQFWPLPRHILGAAFEGDKTAFLNLPYWTTGYVSSGPFRVTDYGLGENLELRRFDDYYLGRPKLDTIIVRSIGDPNTIFAGVQAGAIDMAAHGVIPQDLLISVQQDWKARGIGSVVSAPGSFRFFVIQFHPQWAAPAGLSRDARIRRGLLQAVDRDALREAMLPGLKGSESDSFLPISDPLTPEVGKPFARYPYDKSAAIRLLAEGGWRQASDGRMLDAGGERVQIGIRSSPGNQQDAAIYAQYFRDIGIDVEEQPVPPSLANDREHNATFAAMSGAAYDGREGVFERLRSTSWAMPEGRFAGSNTGHYSNPSVDVLLDRLYTTPERNAQVQIMRDLGEVLATDLPLFPSYYTATMGVVRANVRALTDDFAGITVYGWMSRNSHLWDLD
jgi:peptide/nickel transport system substrate-binding protein